MPVRKGISYLQMTMAECREIGRIVQKVEQWNFFAKVRIDLFGFIDAVAVGPTIGGELPTGITAIQSTGPSGHAVHKRKILANKHAKRWLQCGGYIELWSWRKLLKDRKGKLKVWKPRIEGISLSDFSSTL